MKEETLWPTTGVKKTTWDYYKQLYANKLSRWNINNTKKIQTTEIGNRTRKSELIYKN